MTIVSYISQLEDAAAKAQVPLKQAFIQAGLNTSAYYRALKGASMNLATAQRVMSTLANQS